MLDSLVIHTTCTALYHSSGFMLPAEGLHFSALVFTRGGFNDIHCIFHRQQKLNYLKPCILYIGFECKVFSIVNCRSKEPQR